MQWGIDYWFEYLLRFAHLVAGLAWIGSSFYFIWLDGAFAPPEVPRKNVEGEVFMVHGGFYYQVEKRRIYPGELPKVLHWFKWEATLTWLTGVLLVIYLYFLNGASLLIDRQVLALEQWQGVSLATILVVASWFVYDTIWNPNLIRSKPVSRLLSLAFFGGYIYLLTRLFSGRGAYIMAGTTMGSSMLFNVWVRILPGQTKMLEDAKAGRVPDYSIGLKSKSRSVHNTYFIFPVLFIMLSNHYPQIYNHSLNWLLLMILAASGALTRHAMVTRNPKERWTLLPALIGLGALFYLTATPIGLKSASGMSGPVDYARIQAIMQARCLQCHATHPSDEVFKTPPKGAILETEAQLRAQAALLKLHVVQGKSMPLGNKTQMTDEERAVVAEWLKQQGL